jgi:hypothetical protein
MEPYHSSRAVSRRGRSAYAFWRKALTKFPRASVKAPVAKRRLTELQNIKPGQHRG